MSPNSQRTFGDEGLNVESVSYTNIRFQEDDLTIEELMELDQDNAKSDEAPIETGDNANDLQDSN